jgi:hypothetical protein
MLYDWACICICSTAFESFKTPRLAAHLGWARLLADRYRDLVEVRAPTREDPGGGRHHFAPDDEDAFEYAN